MPLEDLKTQNAQLKKQLSELRGKLPGPEGLIGDWLTLDQVGQELGLVDEDVRELLKGQEINMRDDERGRRCVKRSTLDFVLTRTVAGKSTKVSL